MNILRTRRLVLLIAATLTTAVPVGTAQSTGSTSESGIDPDLTQFHCVWEHPHHCDLVVNIELIKGLGWVNATVGLHNATNSSLPWQVHAHGSIFVNVSYVGGVNATASVNVTLEIANATDLAFVPPLNVTFPVADGVNETHSYAFLLTSSSGALLPILTVGVADLGAWETLDVPLMNAAAASAVTPTPVATPPTFVTAVTAATPPATPSDDESTTPLGPLALAALAAAAVLALPRRRP